MGELLTPDAICARVPGTTKGYWAQLRFTGRGPAFFKPSPKVVLYDADVVDQWIRASAQIKTGQVA
jgi:hypothetical protein